MLDFTDSLEYNGSTLAKRHGRVTVVPEVLAFKVDKEYGAVPEEEVVIFAKNGDRAAVEYLVQKYMGYIRTRTKSYFLIGADREDVVQEGMIGLYKAIRDFDAGKNASFKTFAELCITRHIITAVKSAARQKHSPLNYYVSLNKTEDGQPVAGEGVTGRQQDLDPEQIIIEREQFLGTESRIVEMLSGFESDVLALHLAGIPYGRIAVLLGKDAKAVDNALQRIKKKLEKQLNLKKS